MDEPMCITCGFVWEDGWPEDNAEDSHMMFDSAHYPVWSHQPSEELDIMNEVWLQDTGRNAPRSGR